jgi:hypothetical protein
MVWFFLRDVQVVMFASHITNNVSPNYQDVETAVQKDETFKTHALAKTGKR